MVENIKRKLYKIQISVSVNKVLLDIAIQIINILSTAIFSRGKVLSICNNKDSMVRKAGFAI